MKKYNRTEIMRKAHSLRVSKNMNMSEALRKAWGLAKLEILESELFLLNMKDISGGRTNIAAQEQIRAKNARIAELSNQVNTLKAEIYPTRAIETRRDYSQQDIEFFARKLRNDPYMTNEQRAKYAVIVENGYIVETVVGLDENAYAA